MPVSVASPMTGVVAASNSSLSRRVDRSKRASLDRSAAYARESRSVGLAFIGLKVSAKTISSLTQKCLTDMTFYVSVPVLSEQMHDVDPSVSTASRFFTRTYYFANFFAVIANDIVIHPRSPSGTLATRTPMPKTILMRTVYFMTNSASKKKPTPSTTEIIVIIHTNRLSSFRRGVEV